MTYRYHHFHLICSDLEQTENFFTGVLEAKLIQRRKFGTADGAVLDLNGTTISLRKAREGDNITGDSSQQRYGYDHVTFSILPTNVENGRMAFIKGPDGITIELFQPLA
jgi:catechol 2,3-dioxygenase-like lactoylglutathione lyase family enzyme